MKLFGFNEMKYRLFLFLFLFFFLTFVAHGQSLRFTDTSFVNLGNSASLRLTNFTIEAWIKIEGYGSTTETGSTGTGGGQKGVVPIITRGRAESESASADINYFLGYRLTDMKLVADFEDNKTSLNHSVASGATLPMNTWIQVGASFNVSTQTWKLFIGTAVETFKLTGGPFTPQSASTVNACIGSTLNTGTSVRAGFFNGRIDEVRIWNVALTGLNPGELTTGTGLVGRWGLNEGNGIAASNSIAGGPAGTFSAVIPAWVSGFNQVDTTTNASVHFNGVHDYITFGAAPSLNTSAPSSTGFTLEGWIKIEGNGKTTSTGTGGLSSAIPIISKGRGESDASGLNMNYFLGLSTNDVLVADFEEAAGSSTGLNHPITGGANAVVPRNVWTHVAVTYSISSGIWNLYKNGINVGTLDLKDGIVPENISKQYASIASALTSTGAAEGFFNGKIDEVRIWNRALSPLEISANMNLQLTSGSGLLARWGLNENGNVTATNSVSGSANGTLRSTNISTHPTNGGPSWSTDAASTGGGGVTNHVPNQPTSPSPAAGGNASSLNPNLCATVSDPDGGTVRVRFFGRKKQPGSKFTIIGLPDTQFYTEEPQGANSSGGGNSGIFKSQTQWIANHRVDSNIVFVVQLGDCSQNGDNPTGTDKQIEWKRADTAMKKIESPNVPLPEGIPYSMCVGNHDQTPSGNPNGTSTFYNQYFGTQRFSGRSYYGGHYSANNDNHFELFSAGGIDFIHVSLEYNNYSNATEQATLQPVLNWADSLLKVYKNRKAILSTHNLLTTGNPANFQGPGQKIYDELKDNPNLFLMLAGHVSGEGRRTDVFNGNTVYSLMSDYQSGYTNGGNGYLRIMQFKPSENLMTVKTYSPYSNGSLTGTSSDFSLPVSFSSSFSLLGELNNVASGSTACLSWPGLDPSSGYEWYVEIYDGVNTTTGPVWTFTSPAAAQFTTKITNGHMKQSTSPASKFNNDNK